MIREIIALLNVIVLITVLSGESRARNTIFTDETEARLPPIEDASCDADFVDIDNDGDLDILVSNNHLAALVYNLVLLNDGTGHFFRDSTHMLPNIYGESNKMSLGDVERDGDLDIHVAMDGWNDYLLMNDGSGRFTDESYGRLPRAITPLGHLWAEFFDVDADLDLDNIIAVWSDRRSWLELNDGEGFFTVARPSQFPPGEQYSHYAMAADVDGDFDVDALIANHQKPDNLMINDSHGFFTDMTGIRIEEDFHCTHGGAFADVDADNDFDMVLADPYGPANRIFINRGDGYFDERTDDLLPWNWNAGFQVSPGDVDSDGDLDLLCTNYDLDRETDQLLINDGTGRFNDETNSWLPEGEAYTYILALGDVDGDGDLDIFECNFGTQNRLFINNGTSDAHPPVIPRTFHHPDTKDTLNPYLITTTVWDNISVAVGELEVTLHYQVREDGSPLLSNEGVYKVRMFDCGGYLYRGWIPAQPSGSTVYYHIRAEDRMGNVAYDPPGGPRSSFQFRVDATEGVYENLD